MNVVRPIWPSIQVNEGDSLIDIGGQSRRDFPAWHFAMVNDRRRNDSIEAAIASLDLEGKTVVEIGTGTGLIALLFAKYGANRVVTCEMNANLAALAQRIIAATPFAGRITVVNESSTVAIQRGLVPRRPDVIFTETLDCGVVGEGFMPIAEDIALLAGPDTLVMPRSITQYAALIESGGIANLNRAGYACGFDLRLLNEFSTSNYFPVHAELHQHRLLSQPTALRLYSYLDCPEARPVTVKATEPGRANGLLSWFSVDFAGVRLSNEPYSGSHWHQAYHPLAGEVPVGEADEILMMIDDRGYAYAMHDC